MSEFEQFNVLLPENLAGFLRREAAKRDFTMSGLLRHYVSEACRAAPPEGAPVFPAGKELPGVAANPRSITEAKQRLASLKAEREEILRRKRLWQTNASEDRRIDDLVAEIEVTSRRIEMAERMMPSNGG